MTLVLRTLEARMDQIHRTGTRRDVSSEIAQGTAVEFKVAKVIHWKFLVSNWKL